IAKSIILSVFAAVVLNSVPAVAENYVKGSIVCASPINGVCQAADCPWGNPSADCTANCQDQVTRQTKCCDSGEGIADLFFIWNGDVIRGTIKNATIINITERVTHTLSSLERPCRDGQAEDDLSSYITLRLCVKT
ncbi:hypothetical protein BUE80_DR009784, partial [Diplocarpon rosae]